MNDNARQAADDVLLISARDAARMLNISVRTLWSITAPRGTLISVKIGARVLYSPETLRLWISSQTAATMGSAHRKDEAF